MIVKNNSTSDLTVDLQCVNSDTNEEINYRLALPAGKTKEYGMLELGWAFITGEKIRISRSGYKTKSFQVPPLTR